MTPWKKSLMALWIMQFLAMLGMSQFLPFLPLYVQFLGVKDVARASSWSGLIFGVGFLFAGLMSPVWGHAADRWGRKRMVLRAMLGSGAVVCWVAFARNIRELFLLRILHGTLGGFVSATTALAATIVPESHLGFALGGLQSAAMAGVIVGPMLGGYLVDTWGFRPTLLFAGSLLVAGALVIALLVPDDKPEAKTANPPGIFDNFRFVLSSSSLLSAAGVQFIVQVALMSVQPVLALFVKQLNPAQSHVGSWTGLVFGITGFTTLLGAFFLGRYVDRGGAAPVLQGCLLGAGVVYAPQAFVPGLMTLLFLRALLGVFVGGIQPATQSLIARGAPFERRAGVLGVTFSAMLFGNALGPVLGGVLGAVAGVRFPFLMPSALLLLAWGVSRKYMVSPHALAPAAGETVL